MSRYRRQRMTPLCMVLSSPKASCRHARRSSRACAGASTGRLSMQKSSTMASFLNAMVCLATVYGTGERRPYVPIGNPHAKAITDWHVGKTDDPHEARHEIDQRSPSRMNPRPVQTACLDLSVVNPPIPSPHSLHSDRYSIRRINSAVKENPFFSGKQRRRETEISTDHDVISAIQCRSRRGDRR